MKYGLYLFFGLFLWLATVDCTYLPLLCIVHCTFWGGSVSGSADPCLWQMDPDADLDPAIFIIDFQDANKKRNFENVFLHVTFRRYIYIIFQSQKEGTKHYNQGFSYYFYLMIEGSGSGSIPLTNGSGSRRPKNMWIRIRIRIRNTACEDIRLGHIQM